MDVTAFFFSDCHLGQLANTNKANRKALDFFVGPLPPPWGHDLGQAASGPSQPKPLPTKEKPSAKSDLSFLAQKGCREELKGQCGVGSWDASP